MATAQKARKHAATEIGADEARQCLGDLIDRAGFRGERFVLTRHTKRVVALVSIEDLNAIEQGDVAAK